MTNAMPPTRRRLPAQAAVELAIALPVLVWCALGTLDVGRVFYTYIGLTNAAREGARRATLVAPACDSTRIAAIRATVRAEQSGLFPATVSDTVISVDCTNASQRVVTITDYPFQPVTPFIASALGDPSGVIRLTSSATLPVVNQ